MWGRGESSAGSLQVPASDNDKVRRRTPHKALYAEGTYASDVVLHQRGFFAREVPVTGRPFGDKTLEDLALIGYKCIYFVDTRLARICCACMTSHAAG